ncbi:amidase family protein [Amycolatopsis rubida]|uniref:amidase family protein n=1 Tax=Amycolatopsis rubida TaxID=112413 RepID=UPI000B8107DF|nr:amidase family protein [Amycolatopsis rubida]
MAGLKPSRGRTTGAPDSGTLAAPVPVAHAVTTTVRDSAALLDAIAGPLPGEAFAAPNPPGTFLDATRRTPGHLRIGLATQARTGVDPHPACLAAVQQTAKLCEELGYYVEETVAPFDFPDVRTTGGVLMGADLVVIVEDQLAALGRELQPGDVEPFTARPLPRLDRQPAPSRTAPGTGDRVGGRAGLRPVQSRRIWAGGGAVVVGGAAGGGGLEPGSALTTLHALATRRRDQSRRRGAS